tara:strand:+ start:304 stop:483 length:180 start_codon:yes stop_codon:yes gene_type:complete
MKPRLDKALYDAVLAYCIEKTLRGYDQAVDYGRVSGFFTLDNELTPRGRDFGQTLTDSK